VARLAPVVRRILWALLALTPVVILARYVVHLDQTTLFILSAAALIPLAWLIGEATEHAAEHTGPGVGGFLNASFGNAPELIIALFAVADSLPGVVRGSLTGSVVSNLLLVLGAAVIAGGDGKVDTRSLRWQLAAVLGAVVLLLIPSIPAWNGGSHDRHGLYLVSIPVSLVLLVAYLVITIRNLRIHRAAERKQAHAEAWSLRKSIIWLGAATLATAFVSETLVHSLDHFGRAVGLDQFFIAVVIVAIVGNAAEHGGAVVIAHRGNTTLATEIAVTSSMQVALFVTPAVCLFSWLVGRGLPLSFRAIEIVTMAVAAIVAAVVIWDGRGQRSEGFLLVGVYVLMVAAYFFA
jgi:Ca2+:H+ antiporter